MGRLGMDMAVRVLWAPRSVFERLDGPGAFGIGAILFLVRWLVTPLTTVRNLYRYDSPVLLPLPLGDEVSVYRFWEQFWYVPYGLLFMLAIVWGLVISAGQMGIPVRFRSVFQVVAVAYFAPWTFTATADCVIIPAGWLMPYSMVAIHMARWVGRVCCWRWAWPGTAG